MYQDPYQRQYRKLRVSLTAACNYACQYCVPNGKKLLKAKHEMSVEQFIKAVGLIVASAGIDQIRITGGEPLISNKLEEFLIGLKQLNIPELCLTTNGQFLEQKLPALLDAKVNRINVSLDTLDPVRFKEICRGGDLPTVLRGIDKAVEAGMKLKINMVPLKQHNADQVVPMLDYCLERGIELRYIELMKMGHLATGDEFKQEFWSMKSLLDQISEHYDYAPTSAPKDSTAVRFNIPGKGDFGIIANESKPFCRTCSRLRLSSAGFIYGCLSNTRRHYIVDTLKLEYEQALAAMQEVLNTAMKDKQDLAFTGETTVMKMIGG